MVVLLQLQLGVQRHRLGSHRRSTHGDRDGLQLAVQRRCGVDVCGIAREDVVYCASATSCASDPTSSSALTAISTATAAITAITTATAAVGAGRLHGRGSAVQLA